MNTITTHIFRLLLLTLLPLVSHAAPNPYWPGYYPPSPYYYPPQPITQAEEKPAAAIAPDATPKVETTTVTEQRPASPAKDEKTIDVSPVVIESSAQPTPEQTEAATTITAHAEVDAGDNYQAELTDEASSSYVNEDAEALTEEIAAAIQQGNFAEAYYLWRPLAEAGSAEAQYGIGWMYHNGYGLAIDDDEAIAWWQLASHQGHVDATFALGMLYGLGEGKVDRDMAQAVRYYHQAIRAGHEDAQLLLRTLMIEGDEDANQLIQTLFAQGQEEDISLSAAVTSNKANVRRGPSTQHKVLTTLLEGHKLLPLKRDGRWLLLGIEGKPFTGWIHDSLVGKEILAAP